MNKYRIQELNSKSCGVYCIYVINFLLKGKSYIDILSHFDPKDYIKNENVIINI